MIGEIKIKTLAIVICNYNKCEYVIKCINSILTSSYKDYDIYVVDNASTDNSINEIKNKYLGKLTLIENGQNLGGSGGFNTGMREALKYEYEYLMLLDNDVILHKDAIKLSLEYLKKNDDVGVVGSKIYSMDNPNQIQELGAKIDFEKFSILPLYKGYLDDGNIPEIVECEYVPACSMMIRVAALNKVGLMQEDNFIYWDDIDWGYRFCNNGYKVVAYSKSIVWHKMGVKSRTNTFGTYYFWRNRVRFFTKYCKDIEKIKFVETLFEELFQSIYMCNYIGKYSSAITALTAVLDSINGIYGKADNSKILDVEAIRDRLKELIEENDEINIVKNTDINHIRNIINRIIEINSKVKINIITDEKNIDSQFTEENVKIIDDLNLINSNEGILITCNHILDLEKYDMNIDNIYIDKYFNIIYGSSDMEYIKNYSKERALFKNILYPVILRGIQ